MIDLAYPYADEVVKCLLERKETGLDHNRDEVYEVVRNIINGRQPTEEEAPAPKLEMYCALQQHKDGDIHIHSDTGKKGMPPIVRTPT